MAKVKKKITIDYDTMNRCHRCGVELKDDNCRQIPLEESVTTMSHLCVDCEQAFFDRLAQVEGKSLALFHTCAALNVPCKPIVLEDVDFTESDNSWLLYLDKLAEKGEDVQGDKILTFLDGETYILRLFGSSFTERDFAKYIYHERLAINEVEKKRKEEEARLPGTPEQREHWGTDDLYPELPMTTALYNELDRQYNNKANDFKGTTLTAGQEDTLVKVARLNVIYDYLIKRGKLKIATDIQKTIDILLGAEQMRKKDEKAVENYRIDTQVVALEKAGFMENGKLLPMDKLITTIMERCIKTKKYDYTLDACDQMIERMWNTLRQNADLYISTELPAELQVEDTWGEFADEKSEEQIENERFTGATKVTFKDGEDK